VLLLQLGPVTLGNSCRHRIGLGFAWSTPYGRSAFAME
jgi:hypothetical protein